MMIHQVDQLDVLMHLTRTDPITFAKAIMFFRIEIQSLILCKLDKLVDFRIYSEYIHFLNLGMQVALSFNWICGWLFLFRNDLHSLASHKTLWCDAVRLSVNHRKVKPSFGTQIPFLWHIKVEWFVKRVRYHGRFSQVSNQFLF